MKTQKLAILIDSYDGNSDVWNNFFNIFNHYWNDCKFKRYLVTNNTDYKEDNLKCIKTGNDRNWFVCTVKALREIKEEYILFLLDDYYFSKYIKNNDIKEIIDYITKHDIYFYRLSYSEIVNKKYIRQSVSNTFPYAINLQPAIWHKETFLNILNKLHNSGYNTPWEFERFFIDKYSRESIEQNIKGVSYDSRDILGFKNAIIQGKYVRSVIYYYKLKTNIILDIYPRGYMRLYDEFFDMLKRLAHKVFTYRQREKIKKILSLFGIKFM